MYAVLFLSAVGVLLNSAQALEVVTGSQCFGSCGGGSTASTDLVCNDDDYTQTQYGQKMAGCLSCESTSLAVNTSMPDGGTTDEYWFMFNMKYTLQVCVIDSTSKIAAVQTCSTDCQPLQPVLDALWLSTTPYANQYDYCSVNSGSFPADAGKCAACLQSHPGSVVLGNFVQIMSDACASQPLAVNGDLVSLPRALLDTSTIAVATGSSISSSSSSTGTTSSSGSAGASTATSDSSLTSSSMASPSSSSTTGAISSTSTSTTSSHGLSTGAAAGIGIGIGLLAAGAIAFLAFWIIRRRRQRRQDGLFAPELPAYSPAPPAKDVQEKDAFVRPAVEKVGAAHELHGHARFEAGEGDGDRAGGPVELDAGGK